MHRSTRARAIMVSRADVRIPGARSRIISPHLERHNAAVHIADRNQQPGAASEAPIWSVVIRGEVRAGDGGADLSTKAVDQTPCEGCAAMQSQCPIAAAQDLSIRQTTLAQSPPMLG